MFDYRTWGRAFYLIGAEILGWTLLLVGLLMLVLPGPGILGAFAGLVVLSTRYEWAHRLRHASKEKVQESIKASVATRTRIVVSLIFSFLLIGWGGILIWDPRLPEALHFSLGPLTVGPHIPGAGTVMGCVVIVSALVAVGLVTYSAMYYGARKARRALA